MGKASKRSREELRAEARARIQDMPVETAGGRLEGGNEMMPEPELQRRLSQMSEPGREKKRG